MNQKEVSELRRRFRPERSAVSHLYGCYVGTAGSIIAYLDEPVSMLSQEEGEMFLGLLKKALSGSLGRNLIDIVFSTEQVVDSEEHRLLSALRDTALQDGAVREQFYQKVIQSLDLDGSGYLILLAHDAYDVPARRGDELDAETGDTVFSYILCCVCPVKDGKLALEFCPGENEFHSCLGKQVVSPPELGFLFPAFNDRAADLYSALFYTRKPDQLHQDFIDAVFHTEPPMSATEQREAFQAALAESLEEGCSMEVVQFVHERIRERLEEHKESGDTEPPAMTVGEAAALLAECGVSEERTAAFKESCGQRFGEGAVLAPANLVDTKRFEVKTAQMTLTMDPAFSALVEARIIDGKKYLLIPAGAEVEINGFPVGLDAQDGPLKQ